MYRSCLIQDANSLALQLTWAVENRSNSSIVAPLSEMDYSVKDGDKSSLYLQLSFDAGRCGDCSPRCSAL